MKSDYGLSTLVVAGALAVFVIIVVAGLLLPMLASVGDKIHAVVPA